MKCSGLRGTLVLFLVTGFAAASAKVAKNVDWYPEITDFPQVDLVSAGDVNEGETLKIPCKARGAKPLNHTWYLISQGKKEIIDVHSKSSSCSLDADGSLVCKNMIQRKKEPQTYQCFVSNHYGKVFSPELKVDVTAIRVDPHTFKPSVHQGTIKYYINNHMFAPCPSHTKHLGANYTWVYKNSTSGEFVPLPDSRSYAVTSLGHLSYANVKKGDLSRPLYCKVSAGSTSYISGYYEFSEIKSLYTPGNPVDLTEGIYGSHEVLRGTTKIFRCIPKGYPIPIMSWWKDGKFVVSGRHNIELQSFNRILVIKNANEKQHTGTYKCGTANPNETIKKELAKAKLTVEGPPVITDRPPKALTASEGKSFSLYCNVRNWQQQFPIMTYYWYKNGKQLKYKWQKIAFIYMQGNLTVSHLESQDSGVYQCEAKTLKGGILKAFTSTRVHVKVVTCDAIVPPSNARFKEHKCRIHSSFLPRTTCTWSCKQGFFGTGRRDYTECQADGTWLAIKYKCEDIEPPRLKKGHGCPNSITMATKGPNDRGREVSWHPPVGEDNSGNVATKVEPPGINGKDDWFQLGLHPIKYTFTDATGHNATCQFNITVFSRTKITTKSPRHITIMKHEPLELKCIANSYPSLLYTWTKSSLGEPNKTITITKHSHVQVLDGGKRLVMRHVKGDDAGKYTCEVINRRYNASGARDMAVTTLEVVKAVEWSPWKQWSSCKSKGCGYKGHKTRRRECLKKNSTHLATGCKGDDNQIKSCTIPCSTLQPGTTMLPSTESSVLDISSIKKAIQNYNGWFKSHYPKLFHYLNTRTGKVAFACALAASGISIVLICWSCNYYISRRRQRKRIVKFSDEDYMDSEVEPLEGEGQGLLVDQETEQTQDQILQEPIYGKQQMEYYEGGYYGETYPEGYNYYYEDDVGYDEGEIVYEMTG